MFKKLLFVVLVFAGATLSARQLSYTHGLDVGFGSNFSLDYNINTQISKAYISYQKLDNGSLNTIGGAFKFYEFGSDKDFGVIKLYGGANIYAFKSKSYFSERLFTLGFKVGAEYEKKIAPIMITLGAHYYYNFKVFMQRDGYRLQYNYAPKGLEYFAQANYQINNTFSVGAKLGKKNISDKDHANVFFNQEGFYFKIGGELKF